MRQLIYYKRNGRSYEMEISKDELKEIQVYKKNVDDAKKEFAQFLKVLFLLEPSRVRQLSYKENLEEWVEESP